MGRTDNVRHALRVKRFLRKHKKCLETGVLHKLYEHESMKTPYSTMVAIGLMKMGICDAKNLSSCLGISTIEANSIIEADSIITRVLTDDSPIMSFLLEFRTPHSCAVSISRWKNEGRVVRCPKCNNLINCIPCINCYCENYEELELENDQYEPRDPPCSVESEPGSEDKIAVMRIRFEKGYKVFHDGDKQITPEIESSIRDRKLRSRPKKYNKDFK